MTTENPLNDVVNIEDLKEIRVKYKILSALLPERADF